MSEVVRSDPPRRSVRLVVAVGARLKGGGWYARVMRITLG